MKRFGIVLPVGTFRLVIATFLVSILLLSGVSLSAQSNPEPAQGIQISPVLVDLNANKGQSYTLKLTVTNITSHELTLKPSVNDFKARDETGNPQIIEDATTDSSYSLRQWIKPLNTLTLKPKQSSVVSVVVNVPNNAEAGGHYSVVRFSAVSTSDNDEPVSIAASVGTLVLARINGEVDEQLEAKELFIEKNGKRGSTFQDGPVQIISRLENTGNVHLKPSGSMHVKNMFGSTVLTSDFNTSGGNILPKSTRRFEQNLDKKFLFGRYTVNTDISYGTHGSVLQISTSFWVIPFQKIAVLLVLIFVIVLLGRKGLKRYHKRIIRKANSKHNSR